MNRQVCTRNLWFCILIGSLIAPAAWPQAGTATVSGTVRDQTGAAITSASVTLTNQATNGAVKTTANETGFPGLVPGPYALVVEAPGRRNS